MASGGEGSGIPDNFLAWIVQPMPFDGDLKKCGKRAKFMEYDFAGSPTVVGRINYEKNKFGCIAYTKDPLPVGKAWRITLLKRSNKWQSGLVS